MTDQTRPAALDLDERLMLSAAAIAAGVNGGEFSAVEIVEATLARIEAGRDGHAMLAGHIQHHPAP